MQTQRHVFANQWLWAVVISLVVHGIVMFTLKLQDRAPRVLSPRDLRVSVIEALPPRMTSGTRPDPAGTAQGSGAATKPTPMPEKPPDDVAAPVAEHTTEHTPPSHPPAGPDAHPQVTPSVAPPETPSPPTDPGGSKFYTGAELSTRPRPLVDLQPNVREAILLTRPGKVLLTLWIESNGQVVSFEALPVDVPQEYATALGEYFASIPYAPGLRDGMAVRSLLKLEIRTAETQEGLPPPPARR